MASEDLRLPTASVVHLEATSTPPRIINGKFVTLLVAVPNEIARAGVVALLQASGHSVAAHCSHEDDLLRYSQTYRPDVVILDESIVEQDSVQTVSRLRAGNTLAVIFLLEDADVAKIVGLMNLNVDGILLSWARAASLIDCVDSVARGRTWVDPDLLRHLARAERCPQAVSGLTTREAVIAQLVSRGLRNKEIARELDLSEGTVKMHLHRIYEKLHVASRTQLALSMAAACARVPASN